jgi:hypothetical protein
MKKPTVKYSKGEIGRIRIVEDFLPSPDSLVLREDNVKVTLSLSQRSVTFFKRAARQRRVPYQRMIRALVDAYAEKQGGKGRWRIALNGGRDLPNLPFVRKVLRTVQSPVRRLEAGASGS